MVASVSDPCPTYVDEVMQAFSLIFVFLMLLYLVISLLEPEVPYSDPFHSMCYVDWIGEHRFLKEIVACG